MISRINRQQLRLTGIKHRQVGRENRPLVIGVKAAFHRRNLGASPAPGHLNPVQIKAALGIKKVGMQPVQQGCCLVIPVGSRKSQGNGSGRRGVLKIVVLGPEGTPAHLSGAGRRQLPVEPGGGVLGRRIPAPLHGERQPVEALAGQGQPGHVVVEGVGVGAEVAYLNAA